MLLMGSIFQCVNPILTIAASLASHSPFVLPIDWKEEADEAKTSFAGDSCSDHIKLLKAFEGWKDAKRSGNERSFYKSKSANVVNAGVHLFPLPYMVYSEKVKTSSVYIRDSTNISDYALLMFGGNLVPSKNGDGIEMLDGYLQFSASKSVMGLIQKVRGEVDRLLKRNIVAPRMDVYAEGKGVAAALVELLHNQNVR
ncbi:DExH-box ATP-dependent RNA helicase DExH1 isoform X2 [Tanacetum coccineum]